MRTWMFSPALLLVGLTLGLLTMWAGASPVGAAGDLITGGWTTCNVGSSFSVACAQTQPCENCDADSYTSCSAYNGWQTCSGYITVISCSSSGDGTSSYGGFPCSGDPGCDGFRSGTCY